MKKAVHFFGMVGVVLTIYFPVACIARAISPEEALWGLIAGIVLIVVTCFIKYVKNY